MSEKARCLVCDNVASSRGLCSSCYQSAAGVVKSGKVTWEQLETLGLANAPTRSGRGSKSAIVQAMEDNGLIQAEANGASEDTKAEATDTLPWQDDK